MARRTRSPDAGVVFHVLNRAVGRATIFENEGDYAAFEKVLAEVAAKIPMRLLSYVLMPNHWHLVVWPTADGQLSRWMQRVTVTHVRRWHAYHHTAGTGPVYQGRYKTFPVQEDDHYYTVCRYVERNPLRANLVSRAEDWRWSSLWHRRHRTGVPWLNEGPLPFPDNGSALVDEPQTQAESEALQRSVARGAPFGDGAWTERTARTLGLESALRMPGRPKKREKT